MRKVKRFLLVVLAAALVVSLTTILPAGAADTKGSAVKVLDQELVLCETDSTGDIQNVSVVEWMGLQGSGTVTVKKEKSFTEDSKFQGLRGFSTPSVEGDYIVWSGLKADGNENALAFTKLSKDMVKEARTRIPIKTEYKYWLDGKSVKLEDITGKSGHFKMELTITNTSQEKTKVKVKDPATGVMKEVVVDVYLPLVISPYDWYFDNKTFYNLECDDTGLVFPMPEFYQVGWTIPLFPPATAASHTIWVEADVKNFHMPSLTLPVAFVFPKTNQTDYTASFKAGFEKLYDGVKQLQTGIQENVINKGLGNAGTPDTLIYGITAVDEGLQKMAAADAVPAMKEGLDEKLIPGVSSAYAGAGQLAAGTDQIAGGLQQIYAGIGSDTTPLTLLYAMNAIVNGLSSISASLGDPSNSATLLYAAYALANNLPGIKALIDGAISMTNSSSSLYALISGAMPDPQKTQALGILSALVNGTAGPPAFPGLLYASGAIGSGGAGTLTYAANAIYGGLDYIKNVALGSTSTKDTLLYAADQVHLKLGEIKEGLGSKLLPGVAQIKAGLMSLQAGLSTGNPNSPGIKEGLMQISTGLESVITGLGSHSTPDSLLYGTGKISEGLGSMKEGLQGQVINQGMAVMSESLAGTVEFLNVGAAEVEAIKKRAEEFNSFLGPAKSSEGVDAENMVRFAFQTKPVYEYKEGSSWVTALILSIVIGLLLIGGGVLLGRKLLA
jgi:putative membrane protein